MGGGQPIDGAVALVIGGAGGIGAAIASRLARGAADVVTADLPGHEADAELDVCDPGAVQAVVDAVRQQRGRLDIVVNTVGVGVSGPVESLDADAWRRSVEVNLVGTVNVVRAAYPVLVAQRRGHLVLVASLAGLLPTPLLVPYAATKAAVVGLATSVRVEAARHGVGVSVVCPGPVDTPFLDTGGVGGEAAAIDVRRYLTGAAGPAVSPGLVAETTIKAIQGNRALAIPGRQGAMAWLAARLSPRAAERLIARSMRRELALASTSTR